MLALVQLHVQVHEARPPDDALAGRGEGERDEGEREKPHEKYPWDGVSGVKPFREFAKTTTVGVY